MQLWTLPDFQFLSLNRFINNNNNGLYYLYFSISQKFFLHVYFIWLHWLRWGMEMMEIRVHVFQKTRGITASMLNLHLPCSPFAISLLLYFVGFEWKISFQSFVVAFYKSLIISFLLSLISSSVILQESFESREYLAMKILHSFRVSDLIRFVLSAIE